MSGVFLKISARNFSYRNRFKVPIAKYLFTAANFSSIPNMAPRDTTGILTTVRKLMKDRRYVQEPLAAYIVPSCDAHNSEYLADIDGRREAVSGFTGSAGTAIITQSQVFCDSNNCAIRIVLTVSVKIKNRKQAEAELGQIQPFWRLALSK